MTTNQNDNENDNDVEWFNAPVNHQHLEQSNQNQNQNQNQNYPQNPELSNFSNEMNEKTDSNSSFVSMFRTTKIKLNEYRDINKVKPLFDINNPKEVLERLVESINPFRFINNKNIKIESFDLYGPVMIVFTLAMLLLFAMKLTFNKNELEFFVLGKAISISFTYWIIFSVIVNFLAFGVTLKFTTIMSITGYSIFGYCLTLAISLVNNSFGFLSAIIFGGLSTAKIFLTLFFLSNQKEKIVAPAGICSLIHFIFIFYLKFAFIKK
ncbi:protein yipf3 [Anaeramoeba ignava]|uniref:Protein yipf3 n=1 Tax=Anaeramoeba ignava TaxID=1746090 RepID=A0A9Q0LCF8_ANAIG|nr:protein yipf3 [Anaeramoeba ignava]